MTDIVHVDIDREAILSHLKLNPRDAATQALLLVCERYGLDPLLKHMVLISGRPYVTRDGLLHVAHRSGQLDGIAVEAETETDTHWQASVSVYRKDMGRPFTYSGRYPKNGGNKAYGPEMAVKTAEVMALRRAFDVTGIATAEEAWAQPETEEAMVHAPERERLRERLAGLDDVRKADARLWCDGMDIPNVVGRMTPEQVGQVHEHLDELEAPFSEDEAIEAEVME